MDIVSKISIVKAGCVQTWYLYYNDTYICSFGTKREALAYKDKMVRKYSYE